MSSRKGGYRTSLISDRKKKEVFAYIGLPVLLVYKPIKRVRLQAGVSLNRLRSTELTAQDSPFSYDTTSKFKQTEVEGLIGIDFKIVKWLRLNFRYGYGFTPIIDGVERNDLRPLGPYTYKERHQTLQFSIVCPVIGFGKNLN